MPPKKAGLIGLGIQSSLSPALHVAEGEALGLDYSYDLLDLDKLGGPAKLPAVIDELQARGYAGVNITHPCKTDVIPLLHTLDEDAAKLGAVNTVVFGPDGNRMGFNTDWTGFSRGLQRGLADVLLDRVVMVGAGGAGAAIVYALFKLGAKEILVHDLDAARTDNLVGTFSRQFPGLLIKRSIGLEQDLAQANGLVNCTPVGMQKYPGIPVPEPAIQKHLWVAEIVYFPLYTSLIKLAQSRGCRVLLGGDMAVFQAVGAFELFTGVKPNAERMLDHFSQLTQSSKRLSA